MNTAFFTRDGSGTGSESSEVTRPSLFRGDQVKTTAKPSDADQCASIWFLRLERAREHGDVPAEREARQKLKAMGVNVQFRRESSR